MNILNENNKNWTSKTELMINLGISPDTIDQIIHDFIIRLLSQVLNGIKKGGFHNLETYYNDFLVAVITEKTKHRISNQDTNATKKAKELGTLLNTVINSGNLKAARDLYDLIMEKTEIREEFKKMPGQIKQIEHALNYTAVIGWKKWSDLKKELAQNFEIFQHRISFKTVAAEAGLVKETDYAERIYGEDCLPTTMISESGIDKIYNCYDR